jgi:Protein of unknown function (DUF669)
VKYNPKDASSCLPKGEYPAVIDHVESKTSKAGNEMDVVTFRVYPDNGREILVDDYIVNPSTLFKLKKIAVALGKKQDFEAGTFQVADHLQSNLTVLLDVEESDEFGDQNKVKGYKAHSLPAAAVAVGAVAKAGPLKDDNIPF